MHLWFDVKYAWRLLCKAPGHSALCVAVVAFSVGLALWSYTLVYSQVLQPLPFPGSERWFSLQVAANATAVPRANLDAYTYRKLLERNRTVDHLGAFSARAAVLSEGEASTSLRAAAISPGLLAAMQVAPLSGRLFEAADARRDATPTVVLSFDAWQSYFAGDAAVVGKQARIDGRPMQVVGVLPRDFYAFEDFALWFPLQLEDVTAPGVSTATVSPLVVLAEGRSIDAVLGEMKATVDDINHSYPDLFNPGRHMALIPAHRMYTHENVQIASTVGFIAFAVLLLGCVNVSMVFLARLLERSRELALRTALGASRGRLLRQCLLETAFVVLPGLLIGCGLAALGVRWTHTIDDFGVRVLATGRSSNVPVLHAVDLAVAVIAAAAIWLLSTLIPARRIAKQDAAVALAGGSKGVAGPGSARTMSLLVGVQVAVSCLVLVICANLVLAAKEETSKPTGLNTERVMISTYPTVFDAGYAQATERLRYWRELSAAIKSRMPGAEVAYTTGVPTRPAGVPVAIENQEGAQNQGTLKLPLAAVSDEYFELLGHRLLAGRLFDRTDDSASLAVAIVDENAVKRYWPGETALGKRIRLNPAANGPWLTIVGVVSNARRPYDRELGAVYQPLRQAGPTAFHLLAKLPPSAQDARDALRAAAYGVDRDLPLHNLQMLDEYLAALVLGLTAMIPAFMGIAAITLMLAAAGLYGLISRSVALRTHEVGVRRAFGGTQWQAAAVFLRQGLLYVGVAIFGGCLGIVVANFLAPSIPNIMNRIVPVTLGVFALMALVIFVSSYLPARRAVALEPGDALRYE
jgi:predicted permease